jgi:serine/threonine-protein kinase
MPFKLDREIWVEVEPYLDQALELPAHEREAWVARLALENPRIAATLRGLLVAWQDMEAKRFLGDSPPNPLAARPDRAGEEIGPYTIESLIGRGGMGEVWLARRSDGRFTGRVAVKFLEARTLSANLSDRFRREGKLLARLTHSHIARLIDAGMTAAGQPYLILEYVEGETIDAFCKSHGLDIAGRVRLFLDVLTAVAHAHANLIVHRDIKPSNVLVTTSGEVKLLDFGIAKFLAPDPTDDDYTAPTRVEEVVLTPAYAAPEQMLGEPQSAATDVFQLGVLLFALLTQGRLPFEHIGTSRTERIKAALDAEPLRPSEVAPVELRKMLRGDLDAIIGKTLRRRSEDRYNSAAALATDLQRFLAHEPVGARDGALAYRARKFIRRYRGAVLGTAGAALALILVAVFALVQMREAQVQRDQARFQEKRAEAESQFMNLMMSTVGSADKPVTAAQILANGMELLQRQYANDPRFRLDMLIRMAARFRDLDSTQQQYDALVAAEKLATQLQDPESVAAIECGAVDPAMSLGHSDEASVRLARGQAALARLRNPSIPARAQCLDAEASVLYARGDEEPAIQKAEQAVAVMEQAGANYDVEYVDLLSHVAAMYWETGKNKEAFSRNQRIADILERNGMGATESGLSAEHALAAILLEFGEVRAAFEREQRVVSRGRKSTPDGSVQPQITTMWGLLQLRMNQPTAAMEAFGASLGEARRTGDLPSQLFATVGRARSLLVQGRLTEVDTEIESAKRMAAGHEKAMRRPLIRARIVEAELLMTRGRLQEARQQVETAVDGLRKTGSNHDVLYLGSALLTESRIAAAQGRYVDAEAIATEALHLFERRARQAEQSADVGEALLILAQERRAQGDPTGTHRFANRAATCLTAALGPDHPLTQQAAAML